MSAAATTLDDLPPAIDPAAEAEWWYRTAGGTAGPVSAAELRRLSSGGPLGGDTLVWREGFGGHWRRFAEALGPAAAGRAGPPAAHHGRWARDFAAIEANPGRPSWSWLGLFGPVAYLVLGMWRKALATIALVLLVDAAMSLGDYGHGARFHRLPLLLALSICTWNLKRDYYRHKVLGETMWPRLRLLGKPWACAAVVVAAMAANFAVDMANPVDRVVLDVAGVWQGEDGNVVIDVAGDRKRIVVNGRSVTVRLERVDDDGQGIVYRAIGGGERLSVRKRWSDDGKTYTLDLFEGDDLVAGGLALLKPV